MKRFAVLSAVQAAHYYNATHNMSSNGSNRGAAGRYEPGVHGQVNLLLGGAMLSGVIIVVVLVCYCCHRNMRKNRPQEYPQYWRTEPDVQSLEVFTMDSHIMCYERATGISFTMEEGRISPLPPGPAVTAAGPPPAYDSLIFGPQSLHPPTPKEKEESPGRILQDTQDVEEPRSLKEEESRRDDEGLPTYEAALNLEANGYV